jgi:hypothetical protein
MAKAKRTYKKNEAPYLTKRKLVSAARAGVRKAAAETMELMGYTIIAYRGWVVKKYADGHIEKISRLETVKSNGILALDK